MGTSDRKFILALNIFPASHPSSLHNLAHCADNLNKVCVYKIEPYGASSMINERKIEVDSFQVSENAKKRNFSIAFHLAANMMECMSIKCAINHHQPTLSSSSRVCNAIHFNTRDLFLWKKCASFSLKHCSFFFLCCWCCTLSTEQRKRKCTNCNANKLCYVSHTAGMKLNIVERRKKFFLMNKFSKRVSCAAQKEFSTENLLRGFFFHVKSACFWQFF